MTFEPLNPEQREALANLLGEDAKPAEIGLVLSLGESVRDAREHDHTTQREDWFCMNLTSFMGIRMAPMLRRLIDAEARVAELEASPLAWTDQLDAKSLDDFLIALGSATEHEPMHEAIDRIHELVASFRSATTDTEPEPASSFFRPGRVYTRDLLYRAPEDRPNFECVGTGMHPSKGARRAFGFQQPGAGQPWVSASQRDEEWADGWIDLGPIRPDRLTLTFAPTQALAEDQEAGE